MSYFGDLMGRSEAAVRDRLLQDEQVIATGRCADITTTGDLDSAGAGWTFVMVTNRRVHWVPSISRRAPDDVCSLSFDWVQACTEIHWRHRAAIVMDHDPLIRRHFVPNGRPLNWEYTSVESVTGPLSTTILGFSRPRAAAAEALKEQLALRGVEVRQAESSDRLPEAATQGT